MSYLRIAGGVLAAALLAWLVWIVRDHGVLAEQHKAQVACVAAAKSPDASIVPCGTILGERITTARQADDCEAALSVRASAAYAIRASCGEQVKRLDALQTATDATLADARDQIAGAGADRDAAVVRAEARATTTADRKAANERTIASAPRDPDGSVRCDVECVRDLTGR